jgi:signal transduction histidine kinase
MRSNMLSDPEQIESTLDLAARNTQRLVSLVNELLDIEKLESDKAEFKFEHIDLEKTVDRSLMLNQTYADRYGVSLTLHSSVTDAVINADHDRLLQVMANLISNAVKFSPPGEPVLIRINEEKNGYKVSISDQGPGIPEEFRKNVFNRFSQADSSDTRKVQGSGLGLAICKAIVKRHKGHIDFDVIPDGGTVFYFTLPKIGRRRALL